MKAVGVVFKWMERRRGNHDLGNPDWGNPYSPNDYYVSQPKRRLRHAKFAITN
jgi:hypothetical protein